MEATLSVVFNESTVLCALFEPQSKGWHLCDLKVLTGWYDVFLGDFEETVIGNELLEYTKSVASKVKDVRVVLPARAVMNRFIPYVPAESREWITELLELEIMQSAPETSVPSYKASFYPMRSFGEKSSLMLAVLSRKAAENNIKKLFMRLGILDCMFVVRHVSAHSAFLYSYPEKSRETAVIVHVDEGQCDVSVLQNRVTVYLNMLPVVDASSLVETIAEECELNVLTRLESKPLLVLHGDGVSPRLITDLEQRIGAMVDSVQRLNAFRMCTTSLDEQHRSFAARSAQRFAVNMGSILQR